MDSKYGKGPKQAITAKVEKAVFEQSKKRNRRFRLEKWSKQRSSKEDFVEERKCNFVEKEDSSDREEVWKLLELGSEVIVNEPKTPILSKSSKNSTKRRELEIRLNLNTLNQFLKSSRNIAFKTLTKYIILFETK